MKLCTLMQLHVWGALKRSTNPALVVSSLTGLMISVVIYQSYFGYTPHPIEIINTAASATVNEYNTVVKYSRTVTVNTPITNNVSRTVRCGEAGVIYDLPAVSRTYAKEEIRFPSHKFIVPYRIAPGTICKMTTVSRYQPIFSLRDHTYPVPDMVFVVATEDFFDNDETETSTLQPNLEDEDSSGDK